LIISPVRISPLKRNAMPFLGKEAGMSGKRLRSQGCDIGPPPYCHIGATNSAVWRGHLITWLQNLLGYNSLAYNVANGDCSIEPVEMPCLMVLRVSFSKKEKFGTCGRQP
jgi:hypothetical protein